MQKAAVAGHSADMQRKGREPVGSLPYFIQSRQYSAQNGKNCSDRSSPGGKETYSCRPCNGQYEQPQYVLRIQKDKS